MKAVRVLERANGAPLIEVLLGGVFAHELEIPRKAVADYLRDFAEEERESQLIQAVEVGIFCLERAGAARDMDFVRSQVKSIIDEVERSVAGIPKIVENGLTEKLGTADGQVLAPIRNMVDATSKSMTERV